MSPELWNPHQQKKSQWTNGKLSSYRVAFNPHKASGLIGLGARWGSVQLSYVTSVPNYSSTSLTPAVSTLVPAPKKYNAKVMWDWWWVITSLLWWRTGLTHSSLPTKQSTGWRMSAWGYCLQYLDKQTRALLSSLHTDFICGLFFCVQDSQPKYPLQSPSG